MIQLEKDLRIIKERFKTIDIVQSVLKKNWDLEIYYNGSWAYVEMGYKTEKEINELVEMIKIEYAI